MHLTRLAAPFAAFVAIALAQKNENPFNIPEGFALTAGKPTTLTWKPTTSGTVTLNLREGSSNNLETIEVIQANIPNDGTYTYTPPEDTTRNSDYTIEIVADDDPSATNYTPFFVLESTNTVPKQNSESASSGAATASASSAAASSASAAETSAAASSTGSSAATSTDSASASSSRASRTAASRSSEASRSSAASSTALATGAGSEAGSDPGPSAVPSSGAVVGAVSGLSVHSGLIAVVLAALAAW